MAFGTDFDSPEWFQLDKLKHAKVGNGSLQDLLTLALEGTQQAIRNPFLKVVLLGILYQKHIMRCLMYHIHIAHVYSW